MRGFMSFSKLFVRKGTKESYNSSNAYNNVANPHVNQYSTGSLPHL